MRISKLPTDRSFRHGATSSAGPIRPSPIGWPGAPPLGVGAGRPAVPADQPVALRRRRVDKHEMASAPQTKGVTPAWSTPPARKHARHPPPRGPGLHVQPDQSARADWSEARLVTHPGPVRTCGLDSDRCPSAATYGKESHRRSSPQAALARAVAERQAAGGLRHRSDPQRMVFHVEHGMPTTARFDLLPTHSCSANQDLLPTRQSLGGVQTTPLSKTQPLLEPPFRSTSLSMATT
jgi:hypothetical protein